MTQRRDSMPCLSAASARWDAEAEKIRYFASFDGSEEWIEVSGKDFSRLTRIHAREALDVICDTIASTLDRVNEVLGELTTFRKTMEELYMQQKSPSSDEAQEN